RSPPAARAPPLHRSGARAAARRRSGVPLAGVVPAADPRAAPAHAGRSLQAPRVLLGARGQPQHQQAGGTIGRAPLPDLPHLSEGAGVSRRVAVTGARGFMGCHVTTSLAGRGDVVVPIPRPFDEHALVETFRTVDVVVHIAGVISAVHEREFVAGNVESTRVVARATRDAGARLVYISSLAAAGPAPPSAPRSEDDPPAPIPPYGRSKLEAERVIGGGDRRRWQEC